MFERHRYFQILTAATLVVLVALTSAATAMSQLRGAAVGEMVICTGHGMRTVLIDADGQPVDAKVECPECLISQADLPAMAASFEGFADLVATAEVTAAPIASQIVARAAAPPARGPPVT